MVSSPLAGCAIVVALVLGACSPTTPSQDASHHVPMRGPGVYGMANDGTVQYYDVSDGDLLIGPSYTEENWCVALEGRAGGWRVAAGFSIDNTPARDPGESYPGTVERMEVTASGSGAARPDEFATIKPFLRYPVLSPLACPATVGISAR